MLASVIAFSIVVVAVSLVAVETIGMSLMVKHTIYFLNSQGFYLIT
ncbi:MAG: hypothetical protein ACOX2A_05660 [Tepidanaerobacteraceae bacterium]